MAELNESNYLTFRRTQPPNRKTPIVLVNSQRTGALLGVIAWYAPWRQFCFYPEVHTIFNVECMADIRVQIAELKAERKK